MFEYNFATEALNSKKPYLTLENGLKINGKIDRVEFYYSDDNKQIQYLIGDYKAEAAKQGSDKDIINNEKLQIPLYLKAMELNLKSRYKNTGESIMAAGGAYYSYQINVSKKDGSTQYTNKVLISPECHLYADIKKPAFTSQQEVEDTINAAVDYAKVVSENIAKGLFALPEDTKACRNCKNYSKIDPICRINELYPNLEEEEMEE